MRGVRPVALTEAGRTKGSSMKNTGKRNEPWITVDEGILEGSTETVEKKKKYTAAGKSQTRAHTLALPNSRIRIGGRECRAIFQWLRPSLNSR